ncbi:MAG TPA: type IV toxin-antitoxin system AbiEi family antitoxin domain-containing protein [Arthrobacter sp.]
MDLTSYLKYAGSVARTATLLQAGFSERTVRNAVSAGDVVRLRHGIVALAGAAPDLVTAVLANGLLCCASAAPYQGLWRLHAPGRLHLLCRHGAAAGVVIHRGSLVPPEFPRPVAGLTDTLLHALRCLPPMDAAVMVESALLQGRTTLDYLRQRLMGNRNGAARRVLELVDGTADSAIEVVARLLFRDQGIYTQTQVELPGIGRVDFLLEGFLIVEIDGGTHLEPAQVKKDRRRNNASALAGYVVLRYGYQDVVYNPQKVIDEVWQVLRGRVVR